MTQTKPYTQQDQKEFFFSKDSVTTQKEFDELFEALFNRDWEVNGEIFNLPKRGWKRGYNKRKKSLGICSYKSKTASIGSFHNSSRYKTYELLRAGEVAISSELLVHNLDKAHDFEDTIRHEIAHAIHTHISGRSDHGRVWKSIARQVGANDDRCHEGFLVKPKGKYTLVCGTCKNETEKYRLPKNKKACGKCCNAHNNGRFSDRFVLEVIKNY